jgi:drug/metabolite transporter (DMT)-like permease
LIRSARLSYLLLTLTVLFWSGNFILGRGIRLLVPPVSLNFWRWMGAIAVLLPFGFPRVIASKELLLKHWKMVALMSIPSIAVFNTFIYSALFRDRLSLRQTAGVFISMAGRIVIVIQGDWTLLKDLSLSSSDLWTLGASLAWAIYSVMLRKRPKQMDPIAFLTVLIAFGLIFSLPFYLRELLHRGGFALTPISLASLAYVAIFPSVLSFIFWNYGVDKVGANRAGIFMHLMPVFSILLAIVFLGESLRLFHVAGMLLIFTGIVMTTYPGKGC